VSTALTDTIEQMINYMLALDDESLASLTKYSGSVVAIDLQNTRTTVYVKINPAGISLSGNSDTKADVTIRGTPVQLLAYVNAMQQSDPLQSGNIEITGNIALAQKVQSVIKNLEIDWEEVLSRWVGDTLAHKLGNTVRHSAAWARQVDNTIRMNISEYLRYETEALPDKTEIDEFNAAVDTLRNDVERLKIRIQRLQQTLRQD
jgi:ubiquinone biosynthesis accessory factor UbiJ